MLSALNGGWIFFLIFFLLLILLRREWLAGLALVVIFAGTRGIPSDYPIVNTAFSNPRMSLKSNFDSNTG